MGKRASARLGLRILAGLASVLALVLTLFILIVGGAGGVPPGCVPGLKADFQGAGEAKYGIPPHFYRLYHEASFKYKIDWSWLAATGFVESAHGKATGPSSAGALGPMQFLISTWERYKSASADPPYEIMDPKDSIFAAAKLLAQAGASRGDYRGASFAYNHAGWYVETVEATARSYGYPTGLYDRSSGGAMPVKASPPALESDVHEPRIFPLPEGRYDPYTDSWGALRPENKGFGASPRHEGTDIFAKEGTPVLSPVQGKVSRSGWEDLGGWRLTIKRSDGVEVYLAHLRDRPAASAGDKLDVGQEVGGVGRTGEGAPGHKASFPPHLHVGIYDRGDVLGDKSRVSSGAVNPYPYLKRWESGTYDEGAQVEEDCAEIQPAGEFSATGDGEDLLANKSVEFSAQARRDLKEGFVVDGRRYHVDPRLIRVLLTVAKDRRIYVSPFHTGHSMYAASGSVSNHYYGRAADIGMIDGEAVSPGCGVCKEVWRSLKSLPEEIRPTEVGAPWLDPSWAGVSFSDAAHQNHLHVGFDRPATGEAV